MNIIIRNLRKISCANIALDGITLVAGANGRGKSTISRAVAMFCALNLHMPELARAEKARKILHCVERFFQKRGVRYIFYRDPSSINPAIFAEIFSEAFWNDPKSLIDWTDRYFSGRRIYSDTIGSVFPRNPFNVPEYNSGFVLLADQVRQYLQKEDDYFTGIVARRYMDAAFEHRWASFSYENLVTSLEISDGDTRTVIGLQNGNQQNGESLGARFVSSVFYLEPIHILDFADQLERVDTTIIQDRYAEGESVPINALTSERVVKEWPPQYVEAKERVLNVMRNLINGRLVQSETTIDFEEEIDRKVTSVPILALASGIKPMATIARALEKGAIFPEGLLVIDEPESNLHPEWQIAFAEFLVIMHKELNVRILLNTHSPYFLKALDFYARQKKCQKCSRYYTIDSSNDGDYRYVTREVTNDINELFADMHRPFSKVLAEENGSDEEESVCRKEESV